MAAEEVVLTQTLTLLPSLAPAPLPPRLLEEFLNVLIDQFELVLVLNRRSHIHADLFNIHPILSTAFLSGFDLKVTRNLIITRF